MKKEIRHKIINYKVILLILISLMVIGCNNPTPTNKVNNKVNITLNKYEVLLSTKDTIYVEAKVYQMYSIGSNTEPTCIFKDEHNNKILLIHNPVYVKEIRTK